MNNLTASVKTLFQHQITARLVALFMAFSYGFTLSVGFASLLTSSGPVLLLVGLTVGSILATIIYPGSAGKQLTLKRHGESFDSFVVHFFSLWVGSALFACMALGAFAVLGTANLVFSLILGTLMALSLAVMPR